VLLLLEDLEDRVGPALALLAARVDDGRQDRRRELGGAVVALGGHGRDHELLVERDEELDERVVERLVLDVARALDEGKQA
jgi:hypothetical protein